MGGIKIKKPKVSVNSAAGSVINTASKNPAAILSPAAALTPKVGDWVNERLTPSNQDKGRREAEARAAQKQNEQYEYNKGLNVKYDETEGAYKTARDAAVNPQIQTMKDLQDQSARQANDARVVYEGSIKPGMLDQMQRSANEARSAMSLSDYMDPNNQVAQSTRDLYDREAQGVHKQGLADTGVLQAMGAQAAGRAFGMGGPMSTGQMTSLYAANQNQAGQAFANTQKQMQSLKEQGLAQGFLQADKAYQAGERAQDRNRATIGDMSSLENQNAQRQGAFRGEQAGYGNAAMGLGLGLANSDLDLGYRSLDRQGQTENARYGVDAQRELNQAQAAAARQQANNAMIGGLVQAGATGAGAYFGGPAGAKVGNDIGGAVNQGMQQPQSQQQYVNPYAVGYR